MGSSKSFIVVQPNRSESGQNFEHRIIEHLYPLGWKTANPFIRDASHPEDFLRVIDEVRKKTGDHLDLLVYVTAPQEKVNAPGELARSFLSDIQDHMLGFINAVVELQPLFTRETLVVWLIAEPRYAIRKAIMEMIPSVIRLVKSTATLEKIEIHHFQIALNRSHSSGYDLKSAIAELTALIPLCVS